MTLYDNDRDLDTFINISDFASTATVTPDDGGSTFTVNGVLEDIPLVGNEYTGDVREDESSFTIKSSDQANISKRDTLTVNSQDFEVVYFDANTSGLTRIVIERRPKQSAG